MNQIKVPEVEEWTHPDQMLKLLGEMKSLVSAQCDYLLNAQNVESFKEQIEGFELSIESRLARYVVFQWQINQMRNMNYLIFRFTQDRKEYEQTTTKIPYSGKYDRNENRIQDQYIFESERINEFDTIDYLRYPNSQWYLRVNKQLSKKYTSLLQYNLTDLKVELIDNQKVQRAIQEKQQLTIKQMSFDKQKDSYLMQLFNNWIKRIIFHQFWLHKKRVVAIADLLYYIDESLKMIFDGQVCQKCKETYRFSDGQMIPAIVRFLEPSFNKEGGRDGFIDVKQRLYHEDCLFQQN